MVQIAAVRCGIQHEDRAAHEYADEFGRAVYADGFVMNPLFPVFQLPAGKQ